MNLVHQAETQCEHFSALLEELNFIGLIVNEWPEFANLENHLRSQDGDYDERIGDESFEG